MLGNETGPDDELIFRHHPEHRWNQTPDNFVMHDNMLPPHPQQPKGRGILIRMQAKPEDECQVFA
jgi:hypothetical protein